MQQEAIALLILSRSLGDKVLHNVLQDLWEAIFHRTVQAHL